MNTQNIILSANQLWISYEKVRNINSEFYDYAQIRVAQKAWELRVIGGKKYILYNEKLKSHREKLGKREDLLAEMEKENHNQAINSYELSKMNFAESIVSKNSIYSELIKERLSDVECRQMMRLCGWLEALNKSPLTPEGGISWEMILEMMQKEWSENRLYGKGVESVGGLKNKLNEYLMQGWKGLIDGRKGNTNNAKYQSWHKALVYALYTESKGKILVPTLYKSFCAMAFEVLVKMPLKVQAKRNFRNQILDNDSRAMSEKSLFTKLEYVNTQTGEVMQIGELVYDKILQNYTWQPVDFETVRSHIKDKSFRVEADKFRHGGKLYNDSYSPFMRLVKPKCSMSLWTADDYVNNFHIIKITDGKKVASSKRLRTYTVWDTATDIPLGSAHGLINNEHDKKNNAYNENIVWRGLFEAMLFVKKHTGFWLAPCEAEIERMFTNGKKQASQAPQPPEGGVTKMVSRFEIDLQKLFKFVSLRQTPQAKLTESIQNTAQNEFFRELEWYVGNNITSTKADSKANPDVKKGGLLSQCVSEEQVVKKWEEFRDFKCRQPMPVRKGLTFKGTRLQYFLANLQPECDKLEDLTMVQIFADHLGCVSTVAERRFELQVKGNIYEMPVSLLTSKVLRDEKPTDGLFKVRWLPHDLSKIYLYHPQSDVFLCEITEKLAAQRAKIEQTQADRDAIGKGTTENKRLQKHILETKAANDAMIDAYDMREVLETKKPIRTWETSEVSPPSEMSHHPEGGVKVLEVKNSENISESWGIYGDKEPSYEALE